MSGRLHHVSGRAASSPAGHRPQQLGMPSARHAHAAFRRPFSAPADTRRRSRAPNDPLRSARAPWTSATEPVWTGPYRAAVVEPDDRHAPSPRGRFFVALRLRRQEFRVYSASACLALTRVGEAGPSTACPSGWSIGLERGVFYFPPTAATLAGARFTTCDPP